MREAIAWRGHGFNHEEENIPQLRGKGLTPCATPVHLLSGEQLVRQTHDEIRQRVLQLLAKEQLSRDVFPAQLKRVNSTVAQFIQAEAHPDSDNVTCFSLATKMHQVVWLQGITLVWMLVECGVSIYGAVSAHSPALLAFGADSFVELLSATVVLLALLSWLRFTKGRAARLTGILLFVLAGVVALVALLALFYRVRPETSRSGIAITFAALVIMPMLAWAKRRTARQTNNRALAADAVQSATCAYLAAVTLTGLAINAVWHIHWIDSAAALVALPILILEGRRALRGNSCGCC